MKLTVYDNSNSKQNPYRRDTLLINVDGSNGRFRFSKALGREIGADEGKTALLAYDSDLKRWYISVGTNPEGIKITVHKGFSGIWNKFLSSKITSNVKAGRASFLVSKEPITVGEDKFYRILTDSPLKGL